MKNQQTKKWDEKPVVFIPKKLDLIKVISEKAPFKEFKMGKAEYIISILFEIPANNKNLNNENGFTPINARMLESVVWDYKKYLEYFIEVGVLETDGYYINGEKSKCYRVVDKYSSQVIPNIREKKICKLSQIRFSGGKKKYAHLFKWFDEGLTIEIDEAMGYLQKEFEQNMANNTISTNDAIARFNRSVVNVFKIHYCSYNVSVDTNIARLHSPLTNLRSDLREFLRFNGAKLASIDIKNSQPYLSARLLDIGFWDSATQKYGNEGVDNKVKVGDLGLKGDGIGIKDIEVYIMIWKRDEKQYCIELQKYLNLILNGQLYEYFQPFLIEELGEEYNNRALVKQQILMCLYSDNVYFKQPKAATKRIFKNHFPGIYGLYSIIKERNKRHLSWILQRIESLSVIEIITKRIAKERPEVPLFTIHDSILTTVGNEHYVEEIMKLELTRLIGFEPTLKVDVQNTNLPYIKSITDNARYTQPIDITPSFLQLSNQVIESLH